MGRGNKKWSKPIQKFDFFKSSQTFHKCRCQFAPFIIPSHMWSSISKRFSGFQRMTWKSFSGFHRFSVFFKVLVAFRIHNKSVTWNVCCYFFVLLLLASFFHKIFAFSCDFFGKHENLVAFLVYMTMCMWKLTSTIYSKTCYIKFYSFMNKASFSTL